MEGRHLRQRRVPTSLIKPFFSRPTCRSTSPNGGRVCVAGLTGRLHFATGCRAPKTTVYPHGQKRKSDTTLAKQSGSTGGNIKTNPSLHVCRSWAFSTAILLLSWTCRVCLMTLIPAESSYAVSNASVQEWSCEPRSRAPAIPNWNDGDPDISRSRFWAKFTTSWTTDGGSAT